MLTNDTPINNGQTFTSAILTVPRSDIGYKIVGSVFTDKAGTIYIEQDYDKSKILSDAFDVSSSYSVTANDGSGFSEDIVCFCKYFYSILM